MFNCMVNQTHLFEGSAKSNTEGIKVFCNSQLYGLNVPRILYL